MGVGLISFGVIIVPRSRSIFYSISLITREQDQFLHPALSNSYLKLYCPTGIGGVVDRSNYEDRVTREGINIQDSVLQRAVPRDSDTQNTKVKYAG